MEIIYKNFHLEKASADKKQGTLKGYASVFENKDRHSDRIMKGAFTKSIEKTAGIWPLLFNHKDQIGMNRSAVQDSKGLKVESVIYKDEPDLQKSKEAWALINKSLEMGFQMGLSIGGIVQKFSINKEHSTYDIEEFEIIEHSVTSTPANAQAQVQSTKNVYDSLKLENLLKEKEEIELELRKTQLCLGETQKDYLKVLEILNATLKTEQHYDGKITC